MASSIYRRYMWVVRTLCQQPCGLTFDEISSRWLRCSLNDEGMELSKRTFRNWINAIGVTLGIDIECARTAPYRYHVCNSEDTRRGLMAWALNAFSMGLTVAENYEIRERILLEEIPSADERLDIILSAMRSNHRIRMTYQSFGRDKMTVTTEPYAVKLSRKRWYVICHSEKHGKEFVYALDRILDVSETDETFRVKDGYSAEREFEGCIGITAFDDIAVEEVRLKITGYLCDYIETLPLHPSQTLVERTPYHSIYTYRLRTDYELVDTICGLGACCEVLAPTSLRERIHQEALKMADKNK